MLPGQMLNNLGPLIYVNLGTLLYLSSLDYLGVVGIYWLRAGGWFLENEKKNFYTLQPET